MPFYFHPSSFLFLFSCKEEKAVLSFVYRARLTVVGPRSAAMVCFALCSLILNLTIGALLLPEVHSKPSETPARFPAFYQAYSCEDDVGS